MKKERINSLNAFVLANKTIEKQSQSLDQIYETFLVKASRAGQVVPNSNTRNTSIKQPA